MDTRIQETMDEPVKKFGKYEYDLLEIEDFICWLDEELPDVDDFSERERVLHDAIMSNKL